MTNPSGPDFAAPGQPGPQGPPPGPPGPNQPPPYRPYPPPGPAGGFGAPHPPWQPSPEARKKSQRTLITIVVVVASVTMLLGAGMIFLNFKLGAYDASSPLDLTDPPAAAALETGDCVVLDEMGRQGEEWVEPRLTGCEDPDEYSYLVARVLTPPLECEPDEMYFETLDAFSEEVAERTCLVPSFAVGACYDIIDDYTLEYETAACDEAAFLVAHVAYSTWWECTAEQEELQFIEANRTFCLEWL